MLQMRQQAPDSPIGQGFISSARVKAVPMPHAFGVLQHLERRGIDALLFRHGSDSLVLGGGGRGRL